MQAKMTMFQDLLEAFYVESNTVGKVALLCANFFLPFSCLG